jgi:hypothetical protein
MSSKTLETLVLAVVLILVSVFIYQNLSNWISPILTNATNAGSQKVKL